ncbi:MAG: O-methyltransferase [Oligoflexia bacterium]|nr:O-methyltransferase [Oligoflexia bacterium]
MNLIISRTVDEYIKSFTRPDSGTLELERFSSQDLTISDVRSYIEPETGKFINLLIHVTRAQRVLEIGTCTGYSAIWFGEALKKTGGRLYTVEHDIQLVNEAVVNIREAGLEDTVEIIHEDAFKALAGFEDGFFDIIFQDVKKALYVSLHGECVRLIKPGGLIIADDTLFKPLNVYYKFGEQTDAYNRLVFADKRLYSAIVPIGEGLTLSVKL